MCCKLLLAPRVNRWDQSANFILGKNLICKILKTFFALIYTGKNYTGKREMGNRLSRALGVPIELGLNVYFHTSLWCLRRFEDFKDFIKPFEAPKRRVKIKNLS